MKKLFLCTFAIFTSISLLAQKQKNKKPENQKQEARNVVLGEKNKPNNKSGKDNDIIWDGTKDQDGGGSKYSKNQPAKVRAAFAKDYPNATNVSWSKYRGDWTSSFNNGIIRSTAVYHANGEIIKIESPQSVKDIFRIKTIEGGTEHFVFYNADGKEVNYDY